MDAKTLAANLSFWEGVSVEPQQLGGGITNVNFIVETSGRKYVVRIGNDIVEHQVMRFNELAASRAAHAAGISPEVLYHEPGVLVLEFIESKTLGEKDVNNLPMLERILPLIKGCHQQVASQLRGPALMFWVFHVLRDYAHTLTACNSNSVRYLADLRKKADVLADAIGPIDIVFSHNDLLPANFLDDGNKLWLIDWDYAGFNSPLFDLGGLASNNGLDKTKEIWLLENYFDSPVSSQLWRSYDAMKCASLLRETMWSMVSEHFSQIAFDYQSYTTANLKRFDQAYQNFIDS